MKKYFMKWIGVILACICVAGALLFLRERYTGNQTETASVQTEAATPFFHIVIPQKYEGTIVTEANLSEKAIQITFQDMSEFMFSTVAVENNDERVISAGLNYVNGQGRLILTMDDMYACDSSRTENIIDLQFVPLKERYDKIVVIDPGHGGADDTGTIAYGYEEKNLTLALAKEIRQELEEQNPDCYVCLTRIEDTAMTEEEREAFAQQIGADIFLSIHTNADPSSRATKGVSTYYNAGAGAAEKRLAEKVQKSIDEALLTAHEGTAQADKEIITKDFQIPAIIIKAGYLTNKQDAMKLGTREYREKIAEAVAQCIGEMK